MNLPILEFLFQCYFLYKRHTHFSTLSVYTVIFNPIIITWYTLYTTINCTPFYTVVNIDHTEIIKCTYSNSVITIHCIDCQSKLRKGLFIGTARSFAIDLIRHFGHASISFFIFPQTEPSVFFQLFRKFLVHPAFLLSRLFPGASFFRGSC